MNAMLPDVDCSYQPQRLDTEASVSCSIMYNLVQEDVGQGMVTNQVLARAGVYHPTVEAGGSFPRSKFHIFV